MGLLLIPVVFQAVAKKNDSLLSVLSEEMLKAEICTPLRICHFLSQMSHESAGFTVTQENLNYSASALLRVFPKYFKSGLEKNYQRKPEMIANRVYANRIGNGAEGSGDGWRFRGRGYIQLTGKNNYRYFSNLLFGDDRLLKNPDLALEMETACKIACAFWTENNLNTLADKDDLVGITKRINGGRIGIDHRKELLQKAKESIGM